MFPSLRELTLSVYGAPLLLAHPLVNILCPHPVLPLSNPWMYLLFNGLNFTNSRYKIVCPLIYWVQLSAKNLVLLTMMVSESVVFWNINFWRVVGLSSGIIGLWEKCLYLAYGITAAPVLILQLCAKCIIVLRKFTRTSCIKLQIADSQFSFSREAADKIFSIWHMLLLLITVWHFTMASVRGWDQAASEHFILKVDVLEAGKCVCIERIWQGPNCDWQVTSVKLS